MQGPHCHSGILTYDVSLNDELSLNAKAGNCLCGAATAGYCCCRFSNINLHLRKKFPAGNVCKKYHCKTLEICVNVRSVPWIGGNFDDDDHFCYFVTAVL